MIGCIFFFFKQNTAYEMRISDWSSDVCSSSPEDTNSTNPCTLIRVQIILQALHTSNAAKWHNGLPLHSIKNRYRADLLQRRDQESKTAAGHKHAQLHFTARMTRQVGKDGNPPDRKRTRLNYNH